MATYTKAQILTLIAEKIADNSTKNITPAFVRDVLVPFTDMLQDAEYSNFVFDGFGQNITNVKQALDYLFNANVPSWQDTDWPDGYFVFYEDALYRSNDVVQEGDGEPDTSAKWDLIVGGTGGEMTAGEIVTALETLAINSALNATKVRYSTGVSVAGQIASMLASMAALQPKLYNSRFFVGGTGESSSWTISGVEIFPVTFFINGKYYNGRKATNWNGEIAIYDYRYEHSGGNTIFHLNPLADPPISFRAGDTIDIVHSSTEIGNPA
jgi:hypothetical protein